MGEEIVERREAQIRWERTPAPEATAFEHAVVENEEGVPECTIFPQDCDEDEILTRWVTATDDAFVSLETVR